MARKEIQGRDKLFYAVLCESPHQWEDELDKLDHVDIWTFSPRTLLHTAVWAGRYEWVEMLLVKGADPTIKDERGMNALELAQLLTTEKENDVNRGRIVDIISLIVKCIIADYASNAREDEDDRKRNTIPLVESSELEDVVKNLDSTFQIAVDKFGKLCNSWMNLKAGLLRSSGVSCVSSNIMPGTYFESIINEATVTSKSAYIDNVSLDRDGSPQGELKLVEGESVIAEQSNLHCMSLGIGKKAPDMMQPEDLTSCLNEYDTVENTSLEVSTVLPREDNEPIGTTDVSSIDSSDGNSYDSAGVKCSSPIQGILKDTAAEFKAGSSNSDEPDRSKVNRGITKVATGRPSNHSVNTPIGRENPKEDEVDPPNKLESIAVGQSPPPAKKVERVAKDYTVVSNCSPAGVKCSSPKGGTPKATATELKAGASKTYEPDRSKVNKGITKLASGRPLNKSGKTSISRESSTKDEVVAPSKGRKNIAGEQSKVLLVKEVERDAEDSSVVSNYNPAGVEGSSPMQGTLTATAAELEESETYEPNTSKNKHSQETRVSMGALSSIEQETFHSPLESTSQVQFSFENDTVPGAQACVDQGLKLVHEPSECSGAEITVVNLNSAILGCSFKEFTRELSSGMENDEIDKASDLPATHVIEKPLHGRKDPIQEQIPSEDANNFAQHDMKDGNGEASYVRQPYPEPQEEVNSSSSDGTRNHCVDTMIKMTVVLNCHRSKYTFVRKFYEGVYSRCPLNALMMKFLIGQPDLTFLIDCESETIQGMSENLVDYDGEHVKGSDRCSFADFHKRIIYLGGLVEDKLKVDQIIGPFCSSLCSMSMYLVFKNGGRPYAREDKVKGEEVRKLISEALMRKKNGEKLIKSIKWALDRKSMIGREIAVISALAKIFATFGLEKGTALLRRQLPSLLGFFEDQVVATLSRECESGTAALTT